MTTVAAIVCIAASAFSCEQSQIRVIDGDTFAFRSEKIRIEGIDAPETKGACGRETETAALAAARLVSLLDGSTVTIERNGKDRHRRTLATVTVEGRDVGKVLVSEGLARKWERKWRPGLDEVWCR